MSDDVTTDDLLAEIEKAQKRLEKATYVEAKNELRDNVYPLLNAIALRMKETEDVVAEFLEESESTIQPELGLQILGTLALARQLCDAYEGGAPAEELAGFITPLRQAISVTEQEVNAVMIDPDEEDTEEPADDDGEEE